MRNHRHRLYKTIVYLEESSTFIPFDERIHDDTNVIYKLQEPKIPFIQRVAKALRNDR